MLHLRRLARVRRDTKHVCLPALAAPLHAALRVCLSSARIHPRRPAPGRRTRRRAHAIAARQPPESAWRAQASTGSTRAGQHAHPGQVVQGPVVVAEPEEPKDEPTTPKETAADDDGIVDTTDEVALLQSENNSLREEVAELKRSLEDAEQRAQGIDPNRLQEGEEDKYEEAEEDDGWVGGVHRKETFNLGRVLREARASRADREDATRGRGGAVERHPAVEGLTRRKVHAATGGSQVDLDNRTIKSLRNELHAKDKNLKLMESKEAQTKKLGYSIQRI